MYTGYWSHCGDYPPPHHHHVDPAMLLAREIEVDTATPSKDGLVGGARPVFLSLEYLVDAGAASPTVKVTTVAGGSNATWSEATPAEGYTVREAVLSAVPGTKVTVAVNNAIARLRWCELVCC
jgi:hypothetical protein